jgi:hypothetical protein
VIYDLIQSHGRTDVYLFYAELLNDHGIVVQHYVDNEMWSEAIKALNKQVDIESVEEHHNLTNAKHRLSSTCITAIHQSCYATIQKTRSSAG